MSPPRIIIFGDSHVHAIQQAIDARRAGSVAVSIEVRRLLKSKPPKIKAPKIKAPKIKTSQAKELKRQALKSKALAMKALEIKGPQIESPSIDSPQIESPSIDSPPIAAPPIESPPIAAPPIESPPIVALPMEVREIDLLEIEAPSEQPARWRFPGATYLERLVKPRARRADGSALIDDTVGSRMLGDTTLEEFLAIASSLRPCDVLVSAVGGNQHAVFSTIQHPERFDFFFPEDRSDATEDNVPLVPFKPLYDFFSTGIRLGDGARITALSQASGARMVHLLAPPPKRDGAFIQRFHESRFASKGIATLGVSSPRLRLKFWQMQTRVLQEICAEVGVETLPPPAAACDVDGFLDQSYYAPDATHANAAYGELVLRQLEHCFAGTVS